VNVSVESHGDDDDDDDEAGENSWLVHQSSMAILPAEISGSE
jgi:hypothetical protein